MKNQIQFLILFIVLGFCSLQAQVTQEWIARYNGPQKAGDEALSIAVDGSGNVYVTGLINVDGFLSDYGTIKYNSSGIELWVQIYNGPGYSTDYPSSLAVDDSGNVYVTGGGVDNSYSDCLTIKYNSSGVQQWIQRYNGPGNWDFGRSLAVDKSGNVYVTGDDATIKYNSSGVQQWVQSGGASLAVDDSGNVYVSGGTTIKYNSSGVQQWVQRYSTPGSRCGAYSVVVDGSGNVYVIGEILDLYTGNNDYLTINYNTSGVQQWVQRYNGTANSYDGVRSLAADGLGNVYVTGISRGTSNDYVTIKYNSTGDSLWVARYNGPGNSDDQASSLSVDGLGNVYVTGQRNNVDNATIKYNSSGVKQWVQICNGTANHLVSGPSIAVDVSGNVYVTGASGTSMFNCDYVTIKYSQTEGIPAPSNLEAQSIDSSFIRVTWQDNSNDEDGFYIERMQTNLSTHWEIIDVVPQNVNQYSDFFVTRGLKYFYRVKAYLDNTYSEYSNIDSAILMGNPSIIPTPPSKLTLLKRTANTISMGWSDNSSNENGFIIFRKSKC